MSETADSAAGRSGGDSRSAPLARSAGLAAGVRPRSLRLCADPFSQSRAGARLDRSNGAVQAARRGFWRSAPGTIPYGSLAVHVVLALFKLAGCRTWRVAPWEATQIALGLSIPILAAAHVAGTRFVAEAAGSTIPTRRRCGFWPGLALSQSLLLVVVWLHATIGLHHWLRTMRWYASWSPVLLVGAVLVPTLAITGWIEAARRLFLKTFAEPPMTDAQFAVGAILIERAEHFVWTVFLVAGLAFLGWRTMDWLRKGPRITYSGGRTLRALPGATLLEISRSGGVPHAVCGGRGRCTTCRVKVLDGLEHLPPPNPTEAAALARIDAPPGVRLACQIRPTHSLEVRPLIPLKDAEPTAGRDAYRWGIERRITVMFADLRGFTSFAERLYPTTPCSCSTAISKSCPRPSSVMAARSTSSSATASWRCSGSRPPVALAAAMRCWPRGPCLLPSTASTPNSPLP